MKHKAIILALFLLTSCQPNQPIKSHGYSDLISTIEFMLSNNNFNGVVHLKNDASTVYSKAIGYSDLEKKTPINLNDQFVIGSISKQFTAVLVLKEYEAGKIQLDDTISQYLTGIEQPWSQVVTIHQLLTHTHGIMAIDKPLEFTAGTQFHYSQLGYELLAQILEKVTGKSFQQLSTSLFEKYGLTQTFHPNNENYKHLVKGYTENQKGELIYSSNSLQNYAAAGSFISNAEDLSLWNHLLYSNKLVKSETLSLMKTKYATRTHPIFGIVDYGYGLLFNEGQQNKQIGALGYAPGFVSASYYYPEIKMNLIVLGNTARNLDDFKVTFKAHTELMDLILEVE
ncbi:MAG: serine hydrolase domain-containing protein [Marinicellaceae bacterium]